MKGPLHVSSYSLALACLEEGTGHVQGTRTCHSGHPSWSPQMWQGLLCWARMPGRIRLWCAAPLECFYRPFRKALLLLHPCNSWFLREQLLNGWRYLPLLRAFLLGLFPYLPLLPSCFNDRGMRKDESRRPGNNWHYESIPPGMSRK